MPLIKLQFRPGVNREATTLSNEGGWYDSNNIRFRSGYPEKIGGLEKTHRMLRMQKYYKDSVNEKNIDRRINQKAERYAKKR